MMKKFFDNPWMYKIIALFFSILFFLYANTSSISNVNDKNVENEIAQTATRKQTLTVPLQVTANTNDYFVTGYPETIKITLEGPMALVTSTVNTRNFRAFIDLSKFKSGSHVVPIEVSGLNNQLKYETKPKNVTVKIQPRKSETFPVQIVYNKDGVASGYKIGTPKADPSVVGVTGAKEEVNQVDHIEARVNIPKDSEKAIEQEVMLVAVDKDGRQLNVVFNPATVHVLIPIAIPSKSVRLKIDEKNPAEGKEYKVSTKNEMIQIYGAQADLDKIDELEAELDLEKRNQNFEETITLSKPKGVLRIDPEKVQVTVKVDDKA